MGQELDQLLKQYGVMSPTISSGPPAAPVATVAPVVSTPSVVAAPSSGGFFGGPMTMAAIRKAVGPSVVAAPSSGGFFGNFLSGSDLLQQMNKPAPSSGIQITPLDPAAQAHADAMAKYNIDTAKYTENKAANQSAYDEYKNKYLERMSVIPQYGAAQYNNGEQAQPYPEMLPLPLYMAEGGSVKSNFQGGGFNDLVDTYDLGEPQAAQGAAIQNLIAPAAPVQAPDAPAQPTYGRTMPAGLAEMLGKYQGEGVYGPELKLAREAASRENDAFNAMLQDAVTKKTDNAPSKAEMYFRLASAFGAPTRTGSFAETLGNVGKTLGEHAKETREAEKAGSAGRLALSLEAQKNKMAGAKEDLTTLRSLAGEEMKDKRAVASKMMEEYIKSGQPQSAAGKQALDEGLPPGTPAFQKRVGQIADMNIEKQMASVNAMLAGMSAQQASASLAQQKFGLQQEQATKLTGPEMKLKVDSEDMVAQTGQALANLKQAYALNPKTFDTSLVDTAQRKILEGSGSKAPKIQNTREMENLLEKAALSQLKSTFPGAISNDERKALMDTQGLGAKSIEERGKIMRNAYTALQAIEERAKKRLNQINQGQYRNTEASSGGLE